jgi:DeoR/GlpR family transcriptional regulator of sugar metabolism
MHRLEGPVAKGPFAVLTDAEDLLRAEAALIQKAVFPHRRKNPISRGKLLDVINTHNEEKTTDQAFQVVLDAIVKRNLIPGLYYDGVEAFLIEEHASWKGDVQRQRKERIGRKAMTLIQNGAKVFLDAGSTSEEIVRLLCKRIETRALTKITIATTSVNIADMISDCCVSMGFDDDFSAVRLYLPGGRVRPSTQAIVPTSTEDGARQVEAIGEEVGGFDVGIVGVNGIDLEGGFTTHEGAEAANKTEIIGVSRTRVIVGDSSKLGLTLECRFARFEDEVRLVIDDDGENELLALIVKAWGPKVLLA